MAAREVCIRGGEKERSRKAGAENLPQIFLSSNNT